MAEPPLSQQAGERMLEAMPSRQIFPQGVFQGAKTVDWISKPWAQKSQEWEYREHAHPPPCAAEEVRQPVSSEKEQLTEEGI